MTIERKYTGLDWIGEKQFYNRFSQVERLGFRRYRTDRQPLEDPRFFVTLPEGWTMEVSPAPTLPEDTEIPPPPVRYLHVRDQLCRQRVTLVEKGEDTDSQRLLADIWLATFYTYDFPDPDDWAIRDALGNVKHRIPMTSPDENGRDSLDLVVEWLDQHFPDWCDPFAYWDD